MTMDRREFLMAGLATAAALALESCGKLGSGSGPAPPRPGQTLPTVVANELMPAPRPTLRLVGGDLGLPSPFIASPPAYPRMLYIYDTLLMGDQQGGVQPWLASRFERSSDGLTYTFDLRDNARWHDGPPVTAEDVVFTMDYYRAQDPKLSPMVLFRPQGIRTVRAISPTRVEFTLDKPAATFERQVAAAIPIVPRHIWSSIADAPGAQDPKVLVGSGPYRLKSFEGSKGTYLFEANDDFFLGKPFVKRLELRPVDDELTALLAGDVDMALSGATQDALRPFLENEDYGVIAGPTNFTTALYWNLSKGGALADVRFRRACAMAINRPAIVRRLGGHGEPGNPGFLPKAHPYHADVEQYPFDPEGAERLLDQAGYKRSRRGAGRVAPDGKPLRFQTLVAPESAPVVEQLKAALQDVGVELNLDPVDIFGLFGNEGKYEMAVLIYGGIGTEDPDYLRQIYSSRATKPFHAARGYANEEFDDLADKQLVTFDVEERKRIVGRMQQIVAQDLPLLHLVYPPAYMLYRKKAFDQWSFDYSDKQLFVTGTRGQGLQIRPTTGR